MTEHIFWVSDPVADRTDFVRAWCSCNAWTYKAYLGEYGDVAGATEALDQRFARHRRGAMAEAERRRRIEETARSTVEEARQRLASDGEIQTVMAQYRTGEKQEHEFLISRVLRRKTGETYLMAVCSCQRWKGTKNFGDSEYIPEARHAENWLSVWHRKHVETENAAEDLQARLVARHAEAGKNAEDLFMRGGRFHCGE